MPHWGKSLPYGPHWGIWVAEKFLKICGKSFTWIWHLTTNYKSLQNHDSSCLVFTELLVWEKKILLPTKPQQEVHTWRTSVWEAGEFGHMRTGLDLGDVSLCFHRTSWPLRWAEINTFNITLHIWNPALGQGGAPALWFQVSVRTFSKPLKSATGEWMMRVGFPPVLLGSYPSSHYRSPFSFPRTALRLNDFWDSNLKQEKNEEKKKKIYKDIYNKLEHY